MTEKVSTNKQHLGTVRITMQCLEGILQLPEGYKVVTAHIDSLTNELRLLVSNPALPATEEYQQLPNVEPSYTSIQINDTQRMAVLSEIKVTAYPPRTHKDAENLLAQL